MAIILAIILIWIALRITIALGARVAAEARNAMSRPRQSMWAPYEATRWPNGKPGAPKPVPTERYWSDDPRHPDYGKPCQFRDGPRDPS